MSSWPDIVNGLFEASGTWFVWLSIRRLHSDKKVRGVHWLGVMFFATWGLWNLFYYPHLGQWWSFAGGLGIAVSNMIWLGQIAYYTKFEKKK